MAMRNLEAFGTQAIADFDEAAPGAFAKSDITALCQALKRHEAHATVFVGEVRPDDVVENVRLDGIHGGR